MTAVLVVLRDIGGAYGRLTENGADEWPNLRLVAVTIAGTHGIDPPALFSAPGEGWVRHQSAIWRSDEPSRANAGLVLAAEWGSANRDASVHLRPDAEVAGKLTRWEYAERPLHEGDGLRDGELPVLRQRVAVLARSKGVSFEHGRTQPVLVYHVFWGADPADPHTIRRLFARFVGFGDESILVRKGTP